MKKMAGLFIVFGLLFSSIPCAAAGHGPGYRGDAGYQRDTIRERVANQQKRISRGIESGELTRKEAAMLQDNLDWIKHKYERMKADGILTQDERERLDRMLDQNGEMIQNKKHNEARRLYDTDVRDRIERQQGRIDQGIKSGKLTRREADILQDNLNEIRRRHARMRNDGISIREFEKLDKMLDENGKMIHREKHDSDYRLRRIY